MTPEPYVQELDTPEHGKSWWITYTRESDDLIWHVGPYESRSEAVSDLEDPDVTLVQGTDFDDLTDVTIPQVPRPVKTKTTPNDHRLG